MIDIIVDRFAHFERGDFVLVGIGLVVAAAVALAIPIPKDRPKTQFRHRCHSCGEIYVSDEDGPVCPVCGEKF